MSVSLVKITPTTVVYTVGANMPGYLPESDVAVFATLASARDMLADMLTRSADHVWDMADLDDDAQVLDAETDSASLAGSAELVASDREGDIAWSVAHYGGWTTVEPDGYAYWVHASTLGDVFGDDTESDDYLDVVDAILGR